MKKIFTNQDEIFDYLNKILNDEIEDSEIPDDFLFEKNSAFLSVVITGSHYNSTVTGTVSRAIWELQQEIYRAVASTIYGVDSIKKLSKADLDRYNLVITVSQGSSGFLGEISTLLNSLKDSISSMDSKHKLILFLGAVVVITTGLGLTKVKIRDIESTERTELSKIQTEQMEVVRKAAIQNPLLEKWIDAMTSGSLAITRGASDAESIVIGKEKVLSNEIEIINKRAPRSSLSREIIEGTFHIIEAKEVSLDSESPVRKFWLSANGFEFPVVLDESEFEKNQLDKIWAAFRNRTGVFLHVAITSKNDGTVKHAAIMDIPDRP